ncbi:CE1759 family FMN reductase [Demequina litorisediminis]|uniref:NADPH-dependent FMN reductase-like domain-containing protein n=1 Tax=Demequina litorisediminis TaxID=1849022 RepID=A0ABQ6IC51_9MICO|nr:CE1759 family FMN reductase [Demequina litorisediminis]GMA34319.1 hypothetical protein GCM10025876_05230 [Demequina litorisediminis]
MTADTFHLVVVSAGASDPSSTKMLADRAAQRVTSLARERGHDVRVSVIEIRELLPELPQALSSQFMGPKFRAAIDTLVDADGIIAAAPVYKAGASAAFTGFLQVLDNDLLIGKPVILAATAGTARHALVVDEEMRSLFAYLRTLPVPTGLFAAPEDFSSTALTSRIARAAQEAGPADGVGLCSCGARGDLGRLSARVRVRRRDGVGHQPVERPDAPRHRRLAHALGRLAAGRCGSPGSRDDAPRVGSARSAAPAAPPLTRSPTKETENEVPRG